MAGREGIAPESDIADAVSDAAESLGQSAQDLAETARDVAVEAGRISDLVSKTHRETTQAVSKAVIDTTKAVATSYVKAEMAKAEAIGYAVEKGLEAMDTDNDGKIGDDVALASGTAVAVVGAATATTAASAAVAAVGLASIGYGIVDHYGGWD